MWIRSQDRKILTEIHDVEIDSGFKVWGSGSLIGEYSTEEKALKVLDEIQTHLKFELRFISNASGGDYWLDKGVTVYQMLQDDEVEV